MKELKNIYPHPTPVQEKVVPQMMQNSDTLVEAKTGTGKTAAFAIPILIKTNKKSKKTQALILAPTRELAIQVAESFKKYGVEFGLGASAIYGGERYSVQEQALRANPQIVVATPGRLVDMIKKNKICLKNLNTLILDEADEMLMDFLEDVEWILDQTPSKKQIGLFSATMPKSIVNIAKKYLNNPKTITIKPKTGEVAKITQKMIHAKQKDKLDILLRLLAANEKCGTIIFVRTKAESSELADKLCKRGHLAAPINGDMNQDARERAISKLKSSALNILVATDVAARGIDVERVELVVNYDMPFDLDSYTHRIGRTGRGGRSGNAIIFVTGKDRRLLRSIENKFGEIPELVPPTSEELNQMQLDKLGDNAINVIIKSKKLAPFMNWAEQFDSKGEFSYKQIIAALGYLSLQDKYFEQRKEDKPSKKPKPKPKKFKRKFKKSKERS